MYWEAYFLLGVGGRVFHMDSCKSARQGCGSTLTPSRAPHAETQLCLHTSSNGGTYVLFKRLYDFKEWIKRSDAKL